MSADKELNTKIPQLQRLIDAERSNQLSLISAQDLDRLATAGALATLSADERLKQVNAALDEIRTLRKQAAKPDDNLDLDTNRPPATTDDRNGVVKDLGNLRTVHRTRLAGVQTDLDRIDRLLNDGKIRTARFWLDRLTKVLEDQLYKEQLTLTAGSQDRPDRAAELKGAKHLEDCVADLRLGKFDLIKQAYDDLANYRISDLSRPEAEERLRVLIDRVFADKDLFPPDAVSQPVKENATFFVTMLNSARALQRKPELNLPPGFLTDKLNALGPASRPLAVRAMSTLWKRKPEELGELFGWMFNTLTKEDWNDKNNQLAARGFNMLWNAEKYEDIVKLIGKGADSTLPASTGKDEGRGDREGIWSGFIQPLQHLLGNYVKAVDAADKKLNDPTVNTDKIKGARTVLEALKNSPTSEIVTSYKDVKDSKMIAAFIQDAKKSDDKRPGTIWGFEDVRLPYVQAARETEFGQTPLRMWELWEAVGQTINAAGYPRLFNDTDAMIKEAIAAGIKKIDEGIAEKKPDYAGRSRDDFVKEFEVQVTSYLKFLAQQSPAAKFATAELAGKDTAKLMGAFACKQGLWWAKKTNKPVYYVLDGLKIQDAINYKDFKTKQINASFAAVRDKKAPMKFLDVITLAEVREILKNWDDLSDTVKFIQKGEILTDLSQVEDWKTQMEAVDKTSPAREYPSKARFKEIIESLDPEMYKWTSDRDAVKLVNESEMLKLAVTAQQNVLGDFLAEDCDALYRYGLLPDGIGERFQRVENTRGAEQAAAADELRIDIRLVDPPIKQLLSDALDRTLRRNSGPLPPTTTVSQSPNAFSIQ